MCPLISMSSPRLHGFDTLIEFIIIIIIIIIIITIVIKATFLDSLFIVL